MTFSLVARCARTGQFGVAVTSSSPAVAARCAWARSGVGAASTQNITDPRLGPLLLDALSAGATARDGLGAVMSTHQYSDYRQTLVVDRDGLAAAHSGEHTLGRHAQAVASDVAAAGNLLASEDVPAAMVEAFASTSQQSLADRLLHALRAGLEAGGEEGAIHSAGLVVVDTAQWPVTDLRVDWSQDPLSDLEALWQVWSPQADDYVTRGLDPRKAPSYGVPGDE